MKREDVEPRPFSTDGERLRAALTEEALHAAKTTDLAKTLADRLVELARKEVELARAEARQDLRKGRRIGELAGTTAVLGVAALCCGLICLVLAIGLLWNPVWVALIGFGLFAALAAATALVAKSETEELKPERSIRQARETVHFLREPRTS